MTANRTALRTAGYLAGGAALTAAFGYAAYAGANWARFGHADRSRSPDEQDPLLDEFMPLYDVVERHQISIAAPAAVALAAAREVNVFDSCLVRGVFRGREIALGSHPPDELPTAGLMSTALLIGWGILADVPDQEVIFGAVTKPWEPDPVFRDLLPRDFAPFAEPDYVKIAWTLRADPAGDGRSIFRTETRALATDVEARTKFRRYWALVSPGVALIRRVMLTPVKVEAERRVAAAAEC
jgi:hypothetical protein